MPVLQRLATATEQEGLGLLQELTSPVLGKLKEALIFTRLAYAQRRAFGSRTHVLDGIKGSKMHIGWFEEARLLVLAYNNPACDMTLQAPAAHQAVRWTHTASPSWLTAIAPGAGVHNIVLNIFESFQDGSEGIAETMKTITGGITPRRITCVGYCLGGAVANLTALFAALQYPTADVRCITFGAQYTGNAAFAEAFRWLVGTSFRVVYRRDPVPTFKHKNKLLHGHLVHVHGEIYIDDAVITPGSQPLGHLLAGDANDHSLDRYAEALHQLCVKHMERDQAQGGNMYARFAMCYLKMTGLDQDKSGLRRPAPAEAEALRNAQGDEASANAQRAETAALQQADPGLPQQLDSGQNGLHAASKDEVCTVEPASDTDAPQQPPPCNTSFEQLDPEQQVQCGRKLLERAMLGDPLYEEEAEEVSEMQTQTPGDTQAPSSRGEGADSIASSSSGAFVEAALGTASSNEAAQHAQHGECTLHTDTLASGQQSGPAVGPQAAQHAQQAAPHAQQATHSNVDHHQNQPQAALQSNLHPTDNFSPISNPMQPPAEPAAISESSHHARDTPGSRVDSHQAAPGVAASSMADRDQEQDREGGGRPWLKRAFSMVERENLNVDYESMNSLDKVLVTGKISQAVVVAAAAYRDTAEFCKRTGITNSQLIDDEFHTNTHVHVAWLEGGTAVLAFRGTQTAQDGLQDVKIVRQSIDHLQEMFPGTRAHSGFMQQFAAVCRPDEPEKNMAKVIEKLSGGKTPTRILCCGHSLGGALATLGATWAALQYPMADIRCITFGSPRVGNKAFKRAFHTLVGTSLRLVHGGDPIPVLPPAFVYHHVSGAIHIQNGRIKLKSRPWHFKLHPNVADHMVTRYNAGIYFHMPGGLDEMPLPRPDKKNLQRLSMLYSASNGKAGPLHKTSNGSQISHVPEENESIKAKQSQDLSRDSAGCTIWHVLGCGNMHTDVKEESDSGDESVHTTAVAA